MEYAVSVWDTTVDDESNQLEVIQRCSARWARGHGAFEILSITKLMNDLTWRALSDRRRIHRLSLFHKLSNGELKVNPEEVDLQIHRPSGRTRHRYNLKRLAGKDTHSPLWRGTVCRTITDWNALPDSLLEVSDLAADPLLSFKGQLARIL